MISPREQQKQQIIDQLTALLETRLSSTEASRVLSFAAQFFGALPLESLQGPGLEPLYNSVLACWHNIQQLPSCNAKIAITNPDYEQHGWHSNHTVVTILAPDVPYLVDSIRMELNRQLVAIHRIDNAVIALRRDDELRLIDCDGHNEESRVEALVYIEVDRHSDDRTLASLKEGLTETLDQVTRAFADSDALADRLQRVQDRIAAPLAGVDDGEREETSRFIDWLRDSSFIFLGYDACRIDSAADRIEYVDGSGIGCMGAPGRKDAGRTLSGYSVTAREQLLSPTLLTIRKDQRRSRVYRPRYCDCLVFKVLDSSGSVVGEEHFYGLFTASATRTAPESIPLVRRKIRAVLERSAFPERSHNTEELSRILGSHPWDELLIARPDELFETAMGIFDLQERRRVRLFVRLDPCGQYASCIYYVPKDTYCTALRLRIQSILEQHFEPREIEFDTHYSESILSRTHFYLRLDPKKPLDIDHAELERDVVQASHSWEDLLHRALVDALGEENGNAQFYRYGAAFSSAYREHFLPLNAVYDIQHLNELDDRALSMSFYRVIEQKNHILRFKLFSSGSSLMLSDVVPILENLGVQVDSEHPYKVRYADGSIRWIHDYTLVYRQNPPVDVQMIKAAFQDTFAQVLAGTAENDELNRLVLGAHLSCREVALIRAYSRYMRQLRKGYSQQYIASTLIQHPQIARLLISLFKARFAPKERPRFNRDQTSGRIRDKILRALEQVDSLGEDRILRSLMELIDATVRTNVYQQDAAGRLKEYFSFKLRPRLISDIAQPRPEFEVFVYSPRVEGVHLRFGKVARGGLRWSDRLEDFRTEVLGLVKAQRVKNAVIVPVGAKGGFVVKRPPGNDRRDETLAEGIACYGTFIRGLLDITDNIVEGSLVAPRQVVRHDEDDPYLVVAADKGTATFSDIANGIADEYGFWLGDAFASGGSQGYDHKKMGITARGAWESVKRHFREQGLDTQAEPFSVVGIGDMAGDVFGNGMLLSPCIQLVAAFNHRHIFIDPTPDVATGCEERRRLFDLPGSAWSDYDGTLISEGGGVFSRAAKSIAISPQMRQRFGIDADSLAPNDLINALLKAPVDMIWNGGIGTYVKASGESHADVGDKNNDGIRVNGRELRCRVFAEGGNLGATQLGRCEFAVGGGAVNTDFIDNAGGVDCSDHEVNIKILLNGVVAKGDMTDKQRNALLKAMTEEVAGQVLLNNYRQVQSISLSQAQSSEALDEYREFASHLEDSGMLDRALEAIPEDAALVERKNQGLGLTRPELSVLISYAKGELKEVLMDSWLPRDPHIAREAFKAFPQTLVDGFRDEIIDHQLHRQIVSTQIANEIVNRMGPTFVHRLHRSTGAQYADIAAAYLVARDIFSIDSHWRQIEALDGAAAWTVQAEMMESAIHLLSRASRWFLLNQENPLDIAQAIDRFKQGMEQLLPHLPSLYRSCASRHAGATPEQLERQGVPAELANRSCGSDILFSFLEVINTAHRSTEPLDKVALIFFGVGERLGLDRFNQAIDDYQPLNHWQILARDTYLSDLTAHQSALTSAILDGCSEALAPLEMIERWKSSRQSELGRWDRFSSDLFGTEGTDLSAFAVVIRELVELTKSSARASIASA